MVIKNLKVLNELGFHARVASRIARSLESCQSTVNVRKGDHRYDLKSVTGVIMANAKRGEVLEIEIDGPDEQETAQTLETLFQEKFGER